MPRVHELKVWPEFFHHIQNREKPFEIRKNDRDFQVGDRVLLQEYDPEEKIYTGLEQLAEITYMTDFMQPQGYVVMGLKFLSKTKFKGDSHA